MTKIDIISGFLGAGKTTLIKKLLEEVYVGEKVVLIENEFGEIGIDSGFLKDSGIEIAEMSSGCICCSLVGDFGTALKEVLTSYAPDRIVIEPSGVGKLSDVIAAVEKVAEDTPLELNSFVTVADAIKCKIYMKNFGEFFNNQVEHASAILLSRTQSVSQDKLDAAVALLRTKNQKAAILTTPWDQLTGEQIAEAMAGGSDLAGEMMQELANHHHDHHHEHHHGESCGCGCGHEHHEHEHHGHHHHEHGEDCGCGHEHHDHHEHEHHGHHHHEHGEDCGCGHDHHEHEHHGHHHHEHGEDCGCGACDGDAFKHTGHNHSAHDVFTSWGKETPKKFDRESLQDILASLAMTEDYGTVLRAKGMLPTQEGSWLHFDLVPGEFEIRDGSADYTGRLCVIGAGLDEEKLTKLFGV